MAGRWVGELETVKCTVGSSTTITKGQFYLLQEFFGMAAIAGTTAAGVTGSVTLMIDPNLLFITDQMTASEGAVKGDELYWNTTTSKFTTNADNGQFVAKCYVAQDSSNYAWIKLADQHVASYVRQEEVFDYLRNRVENGALVYAPTSASIWCSATAATTPGKWAWKVNVAAGCYAVAYGSTPAYTNLGLQTNMVIASGGSSTNLLDRYVTDTTICTVIAIGSATAVRLSSVVGTAGSTATAAQRTAASVTALLGHAYWIRVGNATFVASGSSTCTETYQNGVRPYLS